MRSFEAERGPLFRQPDGAFDDQAGFAGNGDIVAFILAPKIAAAGRQLAAMELRLAQFRGPVGYNDAVRSAADGIFRQTGLGRKDPDHDIAGTVAWRGGDHRIAVEGQYARQIRIHCGNLGRIIVTEMSWPGNLVCIDGVSLQSLDFVDIGELNERTGVVPVVIKSLLFS